MKKFISASILIIFLIIIVISGCTGGGDKADIIIYGDSRTNHIIHQDVVDSLMSFDPDVVFHTGDLVENGLIYENWLIFNIITEHMRENAAFYPVAGNHERESQYYYDNFELPNNEKWYSVVYENILFILLNSNLPLDDNSEQYWWLRNELSNASGYNYRIVLFHHPIYNVGLHEPDEKNIGTYIVPLFINYDVDLVISGHDHNYQRFFVDGIYYVITGGGGAPLYEQTRTDINNQIFEKKYHYCVINSNVDGLSFTTYDIDKNIIDQFKVN